MTGRESFGALADLTTPGGKRSCCRLERLSELGPGEVPRSPYGVRAVVARSFERIHRQNLVGMGMLPLGFLERGMSMVMSRVSSGHGSRGASQAGQILDAPGAGCRVTVAFEVACRLEGPVDVSTNRHGGFLPSVPGDLVGRGAPRAGGEEVFSSP